MTENTVNSVSVRITTKLLDRLKDEQYREHKRGEKESTYAELLEKAWTSSRITETLSPDSVKPLSVSTSLRLDDIICESDPPLSDREREWLAQALRILRSGTQLAKSLEENLTGFSMGVDAMLELQHLKAARGDSEGRYVSEDAEDGFAERIKAARSKQTAVRRTLEGVADAGKRFQKKKR